VRILYQSWVIKSNYNFSLKISFYVKILIIIGIYNEKYLIKLKFSPEILTLGCKKMKIIKTDERNKSKARKRKNNFLSFVGYIIYFSLPLLF